MQKAWEEDEAAAAAVAGGEGKEAVGVLGEEKVGVGVGDVHAEEMTAAATAPNQPPALSGQTALGREESNFVGREVDLSA